MSLHNGTDLNVAYHTARDVYKTVRQVKSGAFLENRMVEDFAALALEAIDSIERNTEMSSSCFKRLELYATRDAKSPLLKLGFALTVIFKRLLTDRFRAVKSSETLPQCEPSTSGATALLSEQSELPLSLFSSDEIKKEIKMEEPDEFAAVKLEEPIVDVFCPTTGVSHPLLPLTLRGNETMDDERMDVTDAVPPENATGNGKISSCQAVRKSPRSIRKKIDGIIGKRAATELKKSEESVVTEDSVAKIRRSKDSKTGVRRSESEFVESTTGGLSKVCYLCGETTYRFYVTPVHRKRREVFFTEIITTTPRDKARIAALKASRDHAAFCLSHFHEGLRKTLPKIYQRDVIDNQETLMCDLCDEPQSPCIISPKKATDAQRFFENLIDLTTDQQEKVNYFLYTSSTRAKVCMKHFFKSHEKPDKSDVLRRTVYAMQQRELNRARLKKLEQEERAINWDSADPLAPVFAEQSTNRKRSGEEDEPGPSNTS